MDTTDTLTVRVVVLFMALLGVVGWGLLYILGPKTRPGRAGYLLRGRAVVCLSYALDAFLMSVAILAGWLNGGRLFMIWRNVTRLHAVFVVAVLAVEVLYNEVYIPYKLKRRCGRG